MEPSPRIDIVCCDVLEGLRALPQNSIDCTVTSPPYNLGRIKKPRKFTSKRSNKTWFSYSWKYDVFQDNLPEEEYQRNQIEVLNTLYEKTKTYGSCFYVVRVRYIRGDCVHPITWITQTKWCLRQEIIWNKTSTPDNYGHRFSQVDEQIYWLTKGDHFFTRQIHNPRKLNSIWRIVNKKHTYKHPATFALDIPEICMDAVLSDEADTNTLICDPYCGSGTTAVVAASKGYRFIGFDLSQCYVDAAKERVRIKNADKRVENRQHGEEEDGNG